MNSARWVPFSLFLAGSPIVSAHANPAPLDEARLVQCMLEHAISDDGVAFKDMMVMVLDDDGGAESAARSAHQSMMNFALARCEVGMSALAAPWFQVAAKLDGQQIGEKPMRRPLIN